MSLSQYLKRPFDKVTEAKNKHMLLMLLSTKKLRKNTFLNDQRSS